MTRVDDPRHQARLLHPGLISSGATLLIAALVTDVLYWQTLLFQWNNFSSWLLLVGLIMAALAAIAFVIDLIRRRVGKISWLRFAGLSVAVVLAVLNAFVHSRDSYTAVVPQGIVLSAVVTILLLAVGSTGWSLAARAAAPLARNRQTLS